MKANGFAQVIIERNAVGKARSATIKRVTSRFPRDPLPGALVVRVSLDIPDDLANVQTAEAAVTAGAVAIAIVLPPLEEGAAPDGD